MVDNSLSPYLAEGIRKAGYDSVHVRDLGMASASDQAIFDFALRERFIILTADTDFGIFLTLRQVSLPSVVIFRQSDKRPASLLSLFLTNLPKLTDALSQGAVVVFEDHRIRVRPLPHLPRS